MEVVTERGRFVRDSGPNCRSIFLRSTVHAHAAPDGLRAGERPHAEVGGADSRFPRACVGAGLSREPSQPSVVPLEAGYACMARREERGRYKAMLERADSRYLPS